MTKIVTHLQGSNVEEGIVGHVGNSHLSIFRKQVYIINIHCWFAWREKAFCMQCHTAIGSQNLRVLFLLTRSSSLEDIGITLSIVSVMTYIIWKYSMSLLWFWSLTEIDNCLVSTENRPSKSTG